MSWLGRLIESAQARRYARHLGYDLPPDELFKSLYHPKGMSKDEWDAAMDSAESMYKDQARALRELRADEQGEL